MFLKFIVKAKYFLNLILPFTLLFQWTIATTEKKRNPQINFRDLIFVKCNDPNHSHPPLSQRKPSNDPEKLVNSDLNNIFYINEQRKFFNIHGENNLKKFTTLTELSFVNFTSARGPPCFEV